MGKQRDEQQAPTISLGDSVFLQEPARPPRTSPGQAKIPQGAGKHLGRSLGKSHAHALEENQGVSDQEGVGLEDSAATGEANPGIAPGHGSPAWWRVIDRLRAKVSDVQADRLEGRLGISRQEREQMGRQIIDEVLEEYMHEQIALLGRDHRWSADQQQQAAKDIFDQVFRLGRFQALIDEPGVENVHVIGCDDVWVELAGGRKERRPPVADSDEQLMRDLQMLAQEAGEESRAFTATHPDLDMDLLGSVRLAALAPPIVERPTAVFRVHRFVDITLEDMVEYGTLSVAAAEFLTACVRAGKTIVVGGYPGAGKTTLMRALAGKIHPDEQIVTIETERELHLGQLSNLNLKPIAMQYRPGSGERAADGTQVGEYTLEKAIEKSLRLNSQRILVGEVRGPEINPMIQAMQAGAGTFCTTHAFNPDDTIDRLAGLGLKAGLPEAYIARQLGHQLDIVVQIDKVRLAEGGTRRKVTWISEVQPAEGDRKVATRPLFRLEGLADYARPLSPPSDERLRADLEAVGYDLSALGGMG